MKKFTPHTGIAAPLVRNNIDTDAIIPSVEMKRVSRHGLSDGMFAAWRYLDRVERVRNPNFILNQEAYQGASILLSGINFGCGSSREHAVWALSEYGIRVIIAVSFGAIFQSNCIANGLLPISLPADIVEQLVCFVDEDPSQHKLHIDLGKRTVTATEDFIVHFDVAESDADMLLNGLDPVAMTLRQDDQIHAFQEKDRNERPWVYL